MKITHLIPCIVWFAAIVATAPIRAQNGLKGRFSTLATEQGLSQNTVNSIVKDRFGLLWFATEDGLNRYNGTNIKIYRSSTETDQSLKSNDISVLHEDEGGRLWVGTMEGGLHLYNRKSDNFIRIPTSSNVTALCSDQNGTIWVGTQFGLEMVDPTTTIDNIF